MTTLPYAVTALVSTPTTRVEEGVETVFLTMGEECSRVWRDPSDWRCEPTKGLRVRQALQAAKHRARRTNAPVRIVLQASDGRVLYETPVAYPAVPTAVDEPPTRPLRVPGKVVRTAPPTSWRRS